MRRGGMTLLVAAVALSFGVAQAADTQTKKTEAAKPAAIATTTPAQPAPAAQPAATAPAQPAATAAAPASDANDSPLVRAAKAAAAARNRNPKKRIVIDSTTLVVAPHSSSSTTEAAAPVPQGRSYATGNPNNAAAVAQKEQTERQQAADAEKARQDSLRQEQSRMRGESEEPYGSPDQDEEQVNERLTTIPTQIKPPL